LGKIWGYFVERKFLDQQLVSAAEHLEIYFPRPIIFFSLSFKKYFLTHKNFPTFPPRRFRREAALFFPSSLTPSSGWLRQKKKHRLAQIFFQRFFRDFSAYRLAARRPPPRSGA